MMDFRQRLEQSRSKPADSEPLAEQDEHFSCPYFAVERINSPACLDLRLQHGMRKAIPYAYFSEINFDADTGIEILTTSRRILITGRNLTRLFESLITYRVRYVQMNIGSDGDEDGLFVKEIIFEDIKLL